MSRLPLVRFSALAGAILLVAGTWTPLRAQDPDDQKRAVARISYMDGQVSVRRGDAGEWVAGIINAPLMAEDTIATAPNSRAEVQLDEANLVRMGGNAEIRLTGLEYGRYQMELHRGTVTYRVLSDNNANVEIDTPSVAVRPSQAGTYRISVTEAGETEITARAGNVEVFTPKGSQWVSAGQTMLARGTPSDPEFQMVSAIPYDDWDRWSDSRDQMFTQAAASYGQYIPQGVYGAETLGNYGNWDYVPDYGYCWRPTVVAAGWAPYSYGQWTWLDWYGWTWVSYDPWGWAPFHYGRWFWRTGFGWYWYPGVLGVRHFWSPALVGFFGFGVGGGFGFDFGNVGWVPLAPYEVFHPWWGRGFYGGGFGNRFNLANVNVTNIYRNARVPNAMSSVTVGDFHNGLFHGVTHVSADQVRTAGVVRGQMPLAPGNANLGFSGRQAGFTPRASANTQFFTHQQPGSVQRIPFTQQQRAFEQGSRVAAGGAPPAQNGFRGQAQAGGAGAASRGNESAPARGSESGAAGSWRPLGESGRQAAPAQRSVTPSEGSGWRGSQSPALQNSRPPQSSGNGWGHFGEPGNSTRQQFQSAPRTENRSNPGFGGYSAPRSMAPPVVRERSNTPSNSAPAQQRYSAPSYSAPAQQHYSAPSSSAPRSSGGGGGGRPSGGGGGHSGGGGGGHHK